MRTSAIVLEGFEIVTYGTARRVGNMVGTVQQVTSTALEARPAANVLDALQGQIAGLSIFNNSGDPSQTQSVRLHGMGSLGASSVPLYIVDGIPVSQASVLAMNPNDFESVTVLKDASATAIYGARAANGVIVITTRRGIRHTDARITVRSQWGISRLAERRFYDNIMSTEELLNFLERTGIYNEAQINEIRNNSAFINPRTGELYNTRWIDVFMRDNVPTFQNDISISGGGRYTTYFISGSQFSQEGTAHGSSYNRYTLRSNVESQAKDWLIVGVNLLLSRDKRHTNMVMTDSWTDGGLAPHNSPWLPSVDKDGNRLNILPMGFAHPEYRAKMDQTIGRNSQLTGGFHLIITPIEGLSIIHRSGVEARDWVSDRKRLASHERFLGDGIRSTTRQQLITMSTNNVIEYSFNIDNGHNIILLAGQEGVQHSSRATSAFGRGLTDDRLMGLENTDAETRTMSTQDIAWATLSFFGRAEHNFNDRFITAFSLRNDRSSRFGRENRSALFWSAGVRWNLDNESFMRNLRFLSNSSFNISYGTQGNSEIGNYAHLATTGTATAYDGNLSWILTSPGNPRLTWESQAKFTTGVRTTLFDRYFIGVSFYQRRTSSMLLGVPQPYTTGFVSIQDNVGTLNNTGVDLNLGMDIIRRRNFNLSANVVFNYNVDKVTSLPHGFERWEAVQGSGIVWVVGSPVMIYRPLAAGIDRNSGRQLWFRPGENVDVTTRDPRRVTDVFDVAYLQQNTGHRRFAPINGGFGFTASYRNFQLVTHFAFSLGKWMYDNTSFFFMNPNTFPGSNQFRCVNDFWTPENPNARHPDWTIGQRREFDDFFLSNSSFLRLKNLTLSYRFDRQLLERTGIIRSARVFLTSRNLLTFTRFMGIDPEIDANLVGGARGSAQGGGLYGNSMQFQVGVELTF